jgi:lysophospholipase L1-like esterase
LLLGALAVAAGCTTKVESAGTPTPAGTVPPGGAPPVHSLPAAGSPAAPRRQAPKSVAMIGDSITEGSTAALQSVFAAGGFSDVTIDGKQGRRIDVGSGKKGEPLAGAKVLQGMLAKHLDPDVWVIALGTNDVGHYSTPQEYAGLVDEMLSQIPRTAPVVWVDAYVKADPKANLDWNALLHDKLGARGHGTVASWFAMASNPQADILRKDGIHPNDNGTLVFADLVVKAAKNVF